MSAEAAPKPDPQPTLQCSLLPPYGTSVRLIPSGAIWLDDLLEHVETSLCRVHIRTGYEAEVVLEYSNMLRHDGVSTYDLLMRMLTSGPRSAFSPCIAIVNVHPRLGQKGASYKFALYDAQVEYQVHYGDRAKGSNITVRARPQSQQGQLVTLQTETVEAGFAEKDDPKAPAPVGK